MTGGNAMNIAPFAVIAKEEHYGADVWTDREMDAVRRRRCLCLKCSSMQACTTAALFLDACRKNNVALMVTRCPDWTRKEKE